MQTHSCDVIFQLVYLSILSIFGWFHFGWFIYSQTSWFSYEGDELYNSEHDLDHNWVGSVHNRA